MLKSLLQKIKRLLSMRTIEYKVTLRSEGYAQELSELAETRDKAGKYVLKDSVKIGADIRGAPEAIIMEYENDSDEIVWVRQFDEHGNVIGNGRFICLPSKDLSKAYYCTFIRYKNTHGSSYIEIERDKNQNSKSSLALISPNDHHAIVMWKKHYGEEFIRAYPPDIREKERTAVVLYKPPQLVA